MKRTQELDKIADMRRRALQKFIEEVIVGKLGKTRNWWAVSAGASDPAIRAFLKGESKGMKEETYYKLARFLNVDPLVLKGETNTPKVVPLIGYVGAGAEVHIRDNTAPVEYVEAPPNMGNEVNVSALDVRGDSMYPAYKDGDRIFYARIHEFLEEECLNSECVVQVLDGSALVKTVIKGSSPNLYTLTSYNAPPMQDVKIEWAAPVLWVDKRKNKRG
jgi:phage repressor protein C with HTH and peptisase S24 domain